MKGYLTPDIIVLRLRSLTSIRHYKPHFNEGKKTDNGRMNIISVQRSNPICKGLKMKVAFGYAVKFGWNFERWILSYRNWRIYTSSKGEKKYSFKMC
jgi:hypothetical protein